MEPTHLPLLSPLLQLGAFGICGILLALLWWLLRALLPVLRGNTSALEHLSALINQVRATSQDVRDRLLEWECPFRGREHDHDRDSEPLTEKPR